MDYKTTVSVPGATGYSVKFDALSSTGYSDYVQLCQDKSCSSYWGSPYYSGYASTDAFGTKNSNYSLIIYNSSFVVHFYSYCAQYTCGDPTSYGFKLYASPLYESVLPKTSVLVIDSPHK